MAKITVTAKKDFYDKQNNIQRAKGKTFLVHDRYAKELGDLVSADKVEKKDAPVKESAVKKAPAKTKTPTKKGK